MTRSEHSILVVEDEQTLRAAMVRHLRREFGQVLEAHSCAEALELLQREQIDAIVADVHLEDGDGFQILDAVERSGVTTATVLMTADRNIENAINAVQRQVNGFLLKPFELDALDSTLHTAM